MWHVKAHSEIKDPSLPSSRLALFNVVNLTNLNRLL